MYVKQNRESIYIYMCVCVKQSRVCIQERERERERVYVCKNTQIGNYKNKKIYNVNLYYYFYTFASVRERNNQHLFLSPVTFTPPSTTLSPLSPSSHPSLSLLSTLTNVLRPLTQVREITFLSSYLLSPLLYPSTPSLYYSFTPLASPSPSSQTYLMYYIG